MLLLKFLFFIWMFSTNVFSLLKVRQEAAYMDIIVLFMCAIFTETSPFPLVLLPGPPSCPWQLFCPAVHMFLNKRVLISYRWPPFYVSEPLPGNSGHWRPHLVFDAFFLFFLVTGLPFMSVTSTLCSFVSLACPLCL
jgi:hypothetical protein